VKFVPPKRKPKSSSKRASSTAAVRRLPRRSSRQRTKTGSIRSPLASRRGDNPQSEILPAVASAKAGRNRPSRSSLLDTRVIFCGDNLQKLADFPDALTEIDAFFRRSGKSIIALTVKEILDEEIAKKLA
jgi:hypothetical protein